MTLDNGKSHQIDQNKGDQIRTGYKTSKGIVLITNNNGLHFVCKSKNNSIGVVAISSGDSTANDYYFCNLTYSFDFFSDTYNTRHNHMSMTSLCSVPLGNSGTYGDGLFFIPFYEYSQTGIMSLGGTSYVTNSWFALEE